jgi:hypothetical protein
MSKNQSIRVGPLKQGELEEAVRILRLAFGTFLGVPNPLEFMGDRDLAPLAGTRPVSRYSRHGKVAA